VALGWVIARLPLSWIFKLGTYLGRLSHRFGRSRRLITQTNIRRCFPELNQAQQELRTRRVFEAVGIGALELTIPWLNPQRDLSQRFDIFGQEHLDEAVALGRGVILVGGHYAVMDVICQYFANLKYVDVMYRANKNPVWQWLQLRGRKHFFEGVIERSDTRQTLRRLKQGRAIWYAADQDYGRNHSVFAPFFGIPAATIIATSRFAKLNNSPVLLLRQTRDQANRRWQIHFSAVLDNFPSGDDSADAAHINRLLEADIRQQPEQYLWLHKRFKTRPIGEGAFYPRDI
jgi:Kdo2-lipid IVA lauroyltransferase/acyltransferase